MWHIINPILYQKYRSGPKDMDNLVQWCTICCTSEIDIAKNNSFWMVTSHNSHIALSKNLSMCKV